MSQIFESQWSPPEKDVLLVTLLRALYPDLTDITVKMIDARINHNPNVWLDIPLPKGHSLRSCQNAFEEMRRSLFRTSLPTPVPYNVAANYYPAPTLGTEVSRKRSWEEGPQTASHRELLPRPPRSTDSPIPPVSNGETLMITRPLAPDTHGEPPKKRGRPNKEAVERRDKEYAAKGEIYRPKPRKSRRPERLVGSPLAPVSSTSHDAQGSSVDTPPTETPEKQHIEPDEEGSGSKERKTRTREADLSASHASENATWSTAADEEPRPEEPVSTGSPSDRLLARSNERDLSERSGRRLNEYE